MGLKIYNFGSILLSDLHQTSKECINLYMYTVKPVYGFARFMEIFLPMDIYDNNIFFIDVKITKFS